MITFAPFYKDLSSSSEVMSDGLKERVDHFDYLNAIRRLRDTFYYYNTKDYKFVMQTDEFTQAGDIDVFRSDLSDVPLMGAIVKSNTNFVKMNEGKLILVGADHLICGNVARFFDDDFDMCFFTHTNSLARKQLSLPIYPGVDVERVVTAMKENGYDNIRTVL